MTNETYKQITPKNAPKFILAIDHTADYKPGFTYHYIPEAKTEHDIRNWFIKHHDEIPSLWCGLILKRTRGGAQYKTVERIYKDCMSESTENDWLTKPWSLAYEMAHYEEA